MRGGPENRQLESEERGAENGQSLAVDLVRSSSFLGYGWEVFQGLGHMSNGGMGQTPRWMMNLVPACQKETGFKLL